MPKVAQTDDEIMRCFDVLSELRPQLQRDGFVGQVRQMASEGYRLAFLEAEGMVVTVAGYRIATNFYLGRHLYLDDLVTSSGARSAGYGREMLDWLEAQAEAAGCRFLDLDSGTQRDGAHRFYFAHGFSIYAYHFAKRLGGS